MSYRLIDSNAIAIKYPEVNEMPCVFANLPDGMNGQFIDVQPEVLACGNGELVATPEPKWVPCRNNLPDIGMTVLFCDVDGDEFIGHRASDYWWSVDEKVKSVIAWMPLPEPYKPNK